MHDGKGRLPINLPFIMVSYLQSMFVKGQGSLIWALLVRCHVPFRCVCFNKTDSNNYLLRGQYGGVLDTETHLKFAEHRTSRTLQ